jgi:UDP-glucose 4-epimerase
MTIMITGGAGYIGSHTVQYLLDHNEDTIVIDNLQSGHSASVDVEHFYQIDLRDRKH